MKEVWSVRIALICINQPSHCVTPVLCSNVCVTPFIFDSRGSWQGFQKKMSEVMDNLEAGEMAFDDLNGEERSRGGGRACS